MTMEMTVSMVTMTALFISATICGHKLKDGKAAKAALRPLLFCSPYHQIISLPVQDTTTNHSLRITEVCSGEELSIDFVRFTLG